MKNNLYILIFLLLGQNIQYYATHTTTTALTLVCITALASKSSPAPIPAHTDVDKADPNDQKYDRRMNEADDYEEKKSWPCSCKDFINEVGYGNCMREHPTKGLVCYVTRPSSCIDLVQSIGQRGMLMSALACSSSIENKKINGPKNVRSRGGSTNGKFKCGFDDNELSTTPRGRSTVSTHYRYKWKNSIIPYYFYGNVIKGDRQLIQQLMKIMESKSCFRFQEYNSEPNEHHLKIQVGSESCDSGFSGYISAFSDRTSIFNSKNQLTDQSHCNWEGGIEHELFHAVGIMHTQKRKDRDSYINVHYENIENDGHSQYTKCYGCVLYDSIPYECSSVMHYGTGTFAKKWPLKTMTALDPSTCTLTWSGSVYSGLMAATDNDWKLVKMLSDISCPRVWQKFEGFDCNSNNGGIEMKPWPMISSTTLDGCKDGCINKDGCTGIVMDPSGDDRCFMTKGNVKALCRKDTSYSFWQLYPKGEELISCNGVDHGISCCPTFTLGDNTLGSETLLEYDEVKQYGCLHSCKKLHPSFTGITVSIDKWYRNGVPKCYCEFGDIQYTFSHSYQTCVMEVDCQTGNGIDYRGRVSQTKSGYLCQKWSMQTPKSHYGNTLANEVNMKKYGIGDHNYCRNDGSETGVWCYTMSGERWELCDVPVCVDTLRDVGR